MNPADTDGIPTVTPHRFRHTVGTQLAEGGAQIQTIMAILGHRNAQMSAKQLAQDAVERGWPREVERHNAIADRIRSLPADLGETCHDQEAG